MISLILALIIVFLPIVLMVLGSWAITVFIVWLITLLFGLKFNLAIATGIWLIMELFKSVFKGGN